MNSEERRAMLHEVLCGILGSRNVYFQPPETVKMKYPAIVYELDYIDSIYANDGGYHSRRRYAVTLIDKDPDSQYVDEILKLPLCSYSRHYSSDNLNHDVFELYY